MGGADVLRPIIKVARPEHPSLLDTSHQMDTLFGVTNIPQVLWIDEAGMIVRPPERGSPAPQPTEDPFAKWVFGIMARGTTHPEWYGDRVRDLAAKGPESEWVPYGKRRLSRNGDLVCGTGTAAPSSPHGKMRCFL